MNESKARPAFPRLLGERLCFNFANTIDPRLEPGGRDFLTGYADLARWGAFAGALSVEQAAALLALAADRPAEAHDEFARAIELREAIYRVFAALATAEQPAEPDLTRIREEYLAALAHAALQRDGDRFALDWSDDPIVLDRPLWPVARSAMEVLLEGEPGRIKRCSGATGGCGWLFYDVTKNGSRRWCSMEICGSQAKMRRYRSRARQSA